MLTMMPKGQLRLLNQKLLKTLLLQQKGVLVGVEIEAADKYCKLLKVQDYLLPYQETVI